MSANLVIVESPAKCKKIADFLGPTFTVLATMGHIRALDEDLDAVGLDRDFEPRFHFLKEKSRATKPILEAAQRATTIYLAADDDREGEAIAYSVACLLKKDPLSFPRSVFHEITQKAVKDAIANPRKIDMNRVHAQQARSMLDMMVGFTISPLLWKHVARGLSAGRCQTPALRILYDRESQINSHTTETTWTVQGMYSAGKLSFQGKMNDELEDQESSLNYLENVYGDSTATITSSVTKPWTSNPPKPLITSSLQQEASALYKINPKSTMTIAQKLYEAGHITYMRTDSAVLSEEAVEAAHTWVRATHGEEYVGLASAASPKPKPTTKAKATPSASLPGAQEAHEAIRPTHMEVQDIPGDWTPSDKKIYSLIWRRAIQSTMAQAKGETLTIQYYLTQASEFPWTSQWKRTTFEGWQILGKPANLDSDDDTNSNNHSDTVWKAAQALKPGKKIAWTSINASPKRSRASPRFTEATLIRELEKKGIGRPSTFASLVEVLFDKTYIEKKDISGEKAKHTTLSITPTVWPPSITTEEISLGSEKQKLVPTPLGVSVLTFCLKEFPQLFAYEFTAQMEERLDSISKGKEQWKSVCRDTWTSYNADYARLKDKASIPQSSEKVNDFGGGLKAVMSKNGPLIVQEGATKSDKPTFYTLPTDTVITEMTKEDALNWIQAIKADEHFGDYDGKPIMKKKGKFGEFLVCGDMKVPYAEGDTAELIIAKFNGRKESLEKVVRVSSYIFSKGQYGPYMYKDGLKTKTFVGIPSTIDPSTLTAAEAAALYKSGLEAKKRGGKYKPPS